MSFTPETFCLQSTNVINMRADVNYSLKFLLGLLNSNLLNWFFRVNFPSNNHIASNQLAQLPIPRGQSSLRPDKAEHDLVVRSVEQILEQKRNDPPADTSALEREIDRLVYKLYDLTGDEIAIIEGRK